MKQGQKAWKFIRDIHSGASRNLNQTALMDGVNTYTYGLMFRQWERYASVFSALRMTEETHSRVGLLGSDSAEAVFAFYGLNMVGAEVSLIPSYSALRPERIFRTIREEQLTDLIITDDFAQPAFAAGLITQKEKMGIRNIILLHIPFDGKSVNPVFAAAHEASWLQLKKWFSPFCMETLLALHGDHPVSYAGDESSDSAFILHTSGTTGGAGKPVVLSDRAFNAAAVCFHKLEGYDLPMDRLVSGLIVDLSNAYGIIDQVHMPLSLGAAVAVVPGGALNPSFHKAIPEFRISVLFCISAMLERWMKMPESARFDFSSLRFVAIGGTAVSAKDKRRYYDFLRRHGAGEISLVNGYGISELGGACCLSSPDPDDESIGYLLPGVNLQIYDEDRDRFLSMKNAPCEGILYLNSPSIASPGLDEKTSPDLVTIGRRSYVCTNDLVRVGEDGRITYLGRANRYFLNNSGIRYESGRVETEISRQSGIGSCGVIPVYEKTRHDNIPMLCVKTLTGGAAAPEDVQVVRKALLQVFGVEKALGPDQIPCRVLIAEEDLPRNANGKLDLYRINQGGLPGRTFRVRPVKLGDRIVDFRLLPVKEGPADMIQDVLENIAADLKADLRTDFKANDYKADFNVDRKKNSNTDKEAETMMKNNDPFAAFQAMNQMFQSFADKAGWKSFPGMPGMPDLQAMMNFMNMFNPCANGSAGAPAGFCGMPDMQTMMNFMNMFNPCANGSAGDQAGFCGMPDMQTMMNFMNMFNPCANGSDSAQAKSAGFPFMQQAGGPAGFAGLPFMQQMKGPAGFFFSPWMSQMNQMISWMNQMNQMTWMMLQQMYMQNWQMMNQFFEVFRNSASPAADADPAGNTVDTAKAADEENPESWKEAENDSDSASEE